MAVTRPLKEGSVTTYQQKVALGFPDILASEMDADLDTIYAAWNGNVGTANLVDGSVTYAKLAPDAQMWRDTGTTLTLGTSFATRPVLVQSGAVAVQNAALAAKTRVVTHTNLNSYFSNNFDVAASAQDDATRPSWLLNLGSTGSDVARLRRAPPGSTTLVDLLTLDALGVLTQRPANPAVAGQSFHYLYSYSGNFGAEPCFSIRKARLNGAPVQQSDYLGGLSIEPAYQTDTYGRSAVLIFSASENHTATARGSSASIWVTPAGSTAQSATFNFDGGGNYVITGTIGQKASGTTWSNPSDPRLKEGVTPYARGLAELRKLEPIEYRLKADPDRPCYGFDAAKVRAVFPECVSEIRMKLDPDDEEETDGVLLFDMHPILVALVNAVKELAAQR